MFYVDACRYGFMCLMLLILIVVVSCKWNKTLMNCVWWYCIACGVRCVLLSHCLWCVLFDDVSGTAVVVV